MKENKILEKIKTQVYMENLPYSEKKISEPEEEMFQIEEIESYDKGYYIKYSENNEQKLGFGRTFNQLLIGLLQYEIVFNKIENNILDFQIKTKELPSSVKFKELEVEYALKEEPLKVRKDDKLCQIDFSQISKNFFIGTFLEISQKIEISGIDYTIKKKIRPDDVITVDLDGESAGLKIANSLKNRALEIINLRAGEKEYILNEISERKIRGNIIRKIAITNVEELAIERISDQSVPHVIVTAEGYQTLLVPVNSEKVETLTDDELYLIAQKRSFSLKKSKKLTKIKKRLYKIIPYFIFNVLKLTYKRYRKFKTKVKNYRNYRIIAKEQKKPAKEKQIIFEAFLGRNYCCNPRALYEYMLTDKKYDDYQFIWIFRNPKNKKLPDDERTIKVKKGTKDWAKYLGSSKYIISNSRFPQRFNKGKNQVYLQTWHGTPLKKLGLDIDEVTMPVETELYKERFLKSSSKWDYLLSQNSYSSEIFKRAFGFNGTILEEGYPRDDILTNYQESDVKRIKEELRIPNNKKIVLYAPTYRDNNNLGKGKYVQEDNIDYNKLSEDFPDVLFIVRTHYLITKGIDFKKYTNIINGSNVQDINDLFLISDILITDYSSVYFDYSILKRPIIFFAYDYEEYKNKLRGMYLEYEETIPGKLVTTFPELEKELEVKLATLGSYKWEYPEFNEEFNYLDDGNTSRKILEKVIK